MDALKKINVLMTGAGAPGGPGIIKCLQKDSRIKLICCDIDEYASGRFLNDSFERILPADHPEFIDSILELCHRYQIDVVFPLVTRELFLFAKHKNRFESAQIKVIVSNEKELFIANDKGKIHEHLKINGLIHANFHITNEYDSFVNYLEYFLSSYQKVCVKPTISNGSRGVRLIDDTVDQFDILFNQKPNSLYTSKNDLLNALNGKKIPELILSEVLEGDEFTVDTLIQNGRVHLVAPRVRSKMNSGISVAGEFIEEKSIIEQVYHISESLSLNGPIGFQFKQNMNTDTFNLLEINPRIQGTSVALIGAGVNLPVLSIYSALSIDMQIPPIKWGTHFIRYYSEVYY
jgi:carbamoyl-phosphate synthase large subunit